MRDVSLTKELKKNSLRNSIAILGSVLVVFILAGKRKPVDTEIRAKNYSNNLDLDLEDAEDQYDDIIPGAEKTIIWADSSKQRTKYAIVYLHGFSATRQETAPLTDIVAARLGANLFYTRLSGHGRTSMAMAEANVNDWLNDADEALKIGRQIGEKVIVVGTSTGGTLATWLATREGAEDIAATVLISPNYWVRATGAGLILWPWGKQLLQVVQGSKYEWEAHNEAHAKYWTNGYPTGVLVEMMKLLDYVNNQDFGAIKSPALFIYSPEDRVVDPAEIVLAYERFGSSKKEILTISETEDINNHVLAGDILSPNSTRHIADLIYQFIEDL